MRDRLLPLLILGPFVCCALARAAGEPPRRDGAGAAGGGLGAPPGPAEEPEEDRAGGDREGPRTPARRTAPAETVVLPPAGTYRAPRILRLGGELHGLAVRVEEARLNEVEVEVPAALARRPVTRAELNVLLAVHSLYLHLWDHPEHGRFLVASSRPDWRPETVEYRRILHVHPARFDTTRQAIEAAVGARNRRLAEGARRMRVIADPRTGKIFLWSPRRKWIEDLAELSDQVDTRPEVDHPHLYAYTARWVRADELGRKLLEKLSEGEKRELAIRAGTWGNVLLFRAPSRLGQKVQLYLRALDEAAARRSPAGILKRPPQTAEN